MKVIGILERQAYGRVTRTKKSPATPARFINSGHIGELNASVPVSKSVAGIRRTIAMVDLEVSGVFQLERQGAALVGRRLSTGRPWVL
jgi:hypothetical protein